MKRIFIPVCVFLLMATAVFAAKPKSYQVTGPVLEATPDMIAVQKGDDRWEIARDGAAAVKGGEVKVGSKVTIEYTMQAKSIEEKPVKAK